MSDVKATVKLCKFSEGCLIKTKGRLNYLKWLYLSIVGALFIVGIVVRVFLDMSENKKDLDSGMEQLSQKIKTNYEESILHIKDKYLLLSYHYMRHDKISKLMLKRDNKALFKIIDHDYNKLKSLENSLYSMHFIDLNNRTLLRMHKPEIYDDDLTQVRPIVSYVNKNKKPTYGFEVGVHNLSYRITIPYITFDKKHIGVLEYGIGPDYIEKKLYNNFSVKTELLIENNAIKKMSENPYSEKIKKFTVTKKDPIFDKINKDIKLEMEHQIISADGKTYLVINNLNLENFQNIPIGKIVVAKDITNIINKNKEEMFLSYSINIAILFIGLIVLYIIFSNYSASLKRSYKHIDDLNIQSEKLRHIADIDDLTKVYNKRFFNNYLKEFLKSESKGVIVFFDIDHFKQVNDTYGHVTGDKVLKDLTSIIENSIRKNDVFVRWGGEEFVLLFEDIDTKAAYEKCEELRVQIENEVFTKNISITLSFGLTNIVKEDSMKSLLKRADTLLYKAKADGRNRVVFD